MVALLCRLSAAAPCETLLPSLVEQLRVDEGEPSSTPDATGVHAPVPFQCIRLARLQTSRTYLQSCFYASWHDSSPGVSSDLTPANAHTAIQRTLLRYDRL